MKSLIRKCPECRRYTLKKACPICGNHTVMSIPPRFSPEDPRGKYRRILRKEAGFYLGRR